MGNRDRSRPDLRPRLNPRRQLVLAAAALAAVLGGYYLGLIGRDDGDAPPPAETEAKPWYRQQTAPPGLVTEPGAPLFPDPPVASAEPPPAPPAEPVRAYEDALPKDVYEPAPPPDAAPPAPPAPAASAPPAPAPAVEDTGAAPPWRRFAVAAAVPDDRPVVAVVIDDMGIDRRRTARAIALAGPLTLSFLTYAADLPAQTAAARGAGHELLVHVAMEPGNAALDPGPNVLLTAHDADELRRRLRWGLERFAAYVGVNNHMGSKFTADAEAMAVVMEELGRRGLLFLDSRTTAATVGATLAAEKGVPFAERNIFLDNVNAVDAVNARLAELERLARRQGFAVAIGHPRDATLEALAAWLPGLEAKGLVLVPLSAVVARNRGTG